MIFICIHKTAVKGLRSLRKMSSIKVGLRFRPILKKENLSNVQWDVKQNLISSKNQKYQFSFGKEKLKKIIINNACQTHI